MTLAVDLQRIIDSDHEHLIHPLFHPNDQKEPFVWVQGSGAMLRTADGREFIDGLACLWNVNVGHGRKELAQAAARQMEQLAFASGYTGSTTLPAVQLGEKLTSVMYPSIKRFFFTSGGGEANDSAIKTARFFWNSQGKPDKNKIISLEHGYHGVTLAAMSATGIPAYWPMFGGRLPGFVQIASSYPYRFVHEDTSVSPGVAAANLLEKAILAEGPETVAAFIAEPVQAAGGLIVPPDGYFKRVREICDKYDVLMISDEVITGFGRTGRWFGLERHGVQPDMISFAKGITSGYVPLGGIGLSERVYRVIAEAPPERRWMHAFTYSGHPTMCAVALANLEIIEREGLVEEAERKGRRLLAGLRQLSTLEHVGEVRGIGLMAGIELVQDKASRKAFAPALKVGERLFRACVQRGLFSRFRGDIFMLAPPFVITDEQIDRVVNILGDAIPAAVAP
jgi:adenosylmethionine-8-amino-7-oxononanoate aminotransferase